GGRIDAAADQQVLLRRLAQFLETVLAELFPTVQFGQGAAVEEGAELFAERLLVAASEGQLDAVPEAVACEGDLDRFPRAFVGVFEGLHQRLAAVHEPAGEEADDAIDGPAAGLEAARLAGAADDTLESQGAESLADAH